MAPHQPPQPHYYQRSSGPDAAGTMLGSPANHLRPPHRHGTNTPSSEFGKDGGAAGEEHSRRPLTFWPLLALIYYTSSGGPFGIEPIVGSVGPLLSIAGYLVFPVLWSVPEGLMTAELSSAFPECAGSVAWVTEAFGPVCGYMRGCLSWLSGVIDNAIYPVLFSDYLASLDPHLADPLPRTLLILSFTLTLSYLAWRGLDVAGKLAIAICIGCLLPFVALCVAGAFHLDMGRARTWRDDVDGLSKEQWRVYLGTLFWNLNAFDSAASFAGEVRDPGRTYPRAMLAALAIIIVSYIFPILIGTLAATDVAYASWTDGTFTEIARQVGGEWLAGWIVLSAALSNVGLYLAEMSSDAFQIMGMSEVGMLPSVLGRKSAHNTPTHAIVLATLAIVVMALASTFQEIVTTTNFLYSLAILFEIAAFLLLRLERPHLPRPYKMPVTTAGAALVMLLPTAFIFIILATASLRTWLLSGGLAVLGALSYWGMEFLKNRGLCDFYVAPPAPVPLADLRAGGGGDSDGGGGLGEGGQPQQLSLRMEDDEEGGKESGGSGAAALSAAAVGDGGEEAQDEEVAGYFDDDDEDGIDDQASLCPQQHQQHPQHQGPRRPAAVTLAERVARSLSPRGMVIGGGGGGGNGGLDL